MPVIYLDMQAMSHNFDIVRQRAAMWGFRWLPVLKMVAGYGPVEDFLYAHGFPVTGTADVDEHLCSGRAPDPARHVYINIVPPSRAADVVRRFHRSCVSSEAGVRALDRAAAEADVDHGCLLMLDLGDGREGLCPGEALTAFTEALRKTPPLRVRLTGVGVTLGCLNGRCPDVLIMRRLLASMEAVRPLMASSPVVSLGGSIFWNWFVQHHDAVRDALNHAGWTLELRMGDPLLTGFDMYRNEDFLGGPFRRDVFELRAQVLEVQTKYAQYEGTRVANGHGARPDGRGRASWMQALLDCGMLHTDMTDVTPDLPGAEYLDYSGNYAVLDVTDCGRRPEAGDIVRLRPGYWAVAKAFRTPQVEKRMKTPK